MASRWHGFYSTTQVSRIARVPIRTLYDWKSRGIIRPSILVCDHSNTIAEGYSYADLTIIKILRALRDDQIDLSSAGVALKHLWDRLGPPSTGWADTHVYIVGRRIYAEKQDEWETTAATQFGQKFETRLFGELFQELRDQEEKGSILVPRDYRAFVEIDPDIMGGQPVVKGTRIPTAIFAMLKAKGKSMIDLARLYKPIPIATIEGVIAYEQFLDTAVA